MEIEESQKTHLLVLEGPDLGTLHELDGEAVLGSDPSRADVILRDERLEPDHARIYTRFGRYFAEPLAARERKELNGEVLRDHALSPTGTVSGSEGAWWSSPPRTL